MTSVNIRVTQLSDLSAVMAIYDYGRSLMRESGNRSQWIEGYPQRLLIEQDIALRQHYVIESKAKEILGVFTYIIGQEPNYSKITGKWPDVGEYGTIHRIASAGKCHGIADLCLEFCLKLCKTVRIDTHAENLIMQNWIKSRGFTYCGVIHVEDGTPRLAFQLG